MSEQKAAKHAGEAMDIQRYRLSRCGVHFDPRPCICGKRADSNGDLVLHADHAAAMAAKDEQIRKLREALTAAEWAEGQLIEQWPDFWDVAPQALIDALMKSQSARNAALEAADGRQ